MASGVNPVTSDRGHRRPDQVDDEQRAERRRAQAVRRLAQVKGHVGEHRDLREQHAETDRIRGGKLTVPQQPQDRLAVPSPAVGGARPLAREAGCQSQRGRQVHERKADERRLPAPVRRDHADQRAAAESAGDRAADVRRGRAPDVGGRPLVVDVGDRRREDSRRRQALHEAPEEKLLQVRGCRRRRRGAGQHEGRQHDDASAADEIAEPAGHRRRERDRHRANRDGEAHVEMRRPEDVHEERQQRLGCVEIEEGGEPGQDDRQGPRARRHRLYCCRDHRGPPKGGHYVRRDHRGTSGCSVRLQPDLIRGRYHEEAHRPPRSVCGRGRRGTHRPATSPGQGVHRHAPRRRDRPGADRQRDDRRARRPRRGRRPGRERHDSGGRRARLAGRAST